MTIQQRPEKETHGCLSKSCAQGWELSFSIPSSKPLCLVLKVIPCLRCSIFVLPGPPSHIPWPWPLLHTAALFNLPNAVMGQANQPPDGHWGQAKHSQLWPMWIHSVSWQTKWYFCHTACTHHWSCYPDSECKIFSLFNETNLYNY